MSDATGLQMTLTLPGCEVALVGFRCTEALSEPFELTTELASQSGLAEESLLGQPACLQLWQEGQATRAIHGIITGVARGTTGHRRTRYRATLRPALWQLSLMQTSRFFQQMTPQAIIQQLLNQAGITAVQFNQASPGQPREYCVQYSETSLAFIERLAAEEGWVYYHTFTPDAHTLVFTDTLTGAPALGSATLNMNAGGRAATPLLWEFARTARVAPSRAELKDYTFKRPAYALDHTASATALNGQQDDYEHFDYPGRFKADASGKPWTTTRQQYLRRDAETARVTGNLPGFSAGHAFTLEGGPATDNQRWVITRVVHEGTQDQALEEDAGGDGAGGTHYHNSATLIPDGAPWQATPTPRPRIEGPQIATVTGPEGEEISTDAYGRVQVIFPWDRDAKASAWVRVAHGWAGGEYGMVTLPRIGHEVIVSFLDGDPDQPIITGRTYNATSPVPAPLPDAKTQTLWRTQTHQGEGFNALRFEDKSGSEHIWQHAQKDLDIVVENDRHDDVHNDRHATTGNIAKTRIDGHEDLTVKGERRVQITGDMSHLIGTTRHTRTGTSWLMEAGATVHHSAGHKAVLHAGQTLTLSAGGSFITLDPSGVTMVGPTIRINSGGSAGSGPGQSAQTPLMPGKATATSHTAVTPLRPTAQLQSLLKAPVTCEICEAANAMKGDS